MADVSYQGDANYFTFKQKYRESGDSSYSPPSYYKPAQEPASYPETYTHSQPQTYPEPYPKSYPQSYTRPEAYSKPSYEAYPQTEKPSYYSSRSYEDPAHKSAQYIPTPAPVDDEPTTEKAQQMSTESMNAKSDYTVPMYPLYRSDYYSAKVKSGKPIQKSSGGYAVDEAGETYIKPAAMYYVPERLGVGYDVDHRKGTMRRPAKSDYQAPERLTQS